MEDTEQDIGIPINGELEVVTVPEFEEYSNLSFRTKTMLDCIYDHFDSDCVVLPYPGGIMNQPRLFRQIKKIAKNLKYAYYQLDLKKKEKK